MGLWQKLHEETIEFNGRSMLKRTFKLPDGKTKDFYIANDRKTVSIVALTEGNQIIVTKQFRPGPEKMLYELPGGYIEEGEDPAEAIKRELLEETGYEVGTLQFVGNSLPSAYSNELLHNFVATGCKKVEEQNLDESEFIEVVVCSIEEYKQYVRDGLTTNTDTAYMCFQKLELL